MTSNYATSSGSTLEGQIISVLNRKGFTVCSYSQWQKDPDKYGSELLLKHVPFTNIYGQDAWTEFLLLSEKYNLKIRIECKWQQVRGTVDQKMPFTYLNSIERMPEEHVIIIIDGGGASVGSVAWLLTAIKNKKYYDSALPNKHVEMMTLAQFISWANRTFR